VTKDPVISQSNEASWGGGRDRNAVLGTKGLGSWGRGLALPLPCLYLACLGVGLVGRDGTHWTESGR
jgi:hypothetical protein